MKQNHSVLEKTTRACVGMFRRFDVKMSDFVHTATRRGGFAPLRRRKCSKLLAVTCAFLLTAEQIRLRPDNSLVEIKP